MDVVKYAQNVISIVRKLKGRITLPQIIGVFRGSNTKKMKADGLDKIPEHGSGKTLARVDCERLVQQLVRTGQLEEEHVFNTAFGTSSVYIAIGKKALPSRYDMCFKKAKPMQLTIKNKLSAALKADLTDRLYAELESVRLNHIKNGIDERVCKLLMRKMAQELPLSPADLHTDEYLKICPKHLLSRFGPKFTEHINRFLEEHPELKTIATDADEETDIVPPKSTAIRPSRKRKEPAKQTNTAQYPKQFPSKADSGNTKTKSTNGAAAKPARAIPKNIANSNNSGYPSSAKPYPSTTNKPSYVPKASTAFGSPPSAAPSTARRAIRPAKPRSAAANSNLNKMLEEYKYNK